MPNKSIHTTPFQSGQQTNAKGVAEKTTIKSNVSKMRNIGQPDMLSQALKGRQPPLLPADTHKWNHSKTSKPTGSHYTPMGEFGKPSGKLMSKATNSMSGHGGRGTFRRNA